MDTSGAKKWLKTSGLAALGGGIAAVVATAMDPSKYQFPRDFGTGKMWPYFFSGMGVTFAALLMKSPLGQKAMKEYQDSQAQLAADREELERIKSRIGKAEDKGEKP